MPAEKHYQPQGVSFWLTGPSWPSYYSFSPSPGVCRVWRALTGVTGASTATSALTTPVPAPSRRDESSCPRWVGARGMRRVRGLLRADVTFWPGSPQQSRKSSPPPVPPSPSSAYPPGDLHLSLLQIAPLLSALPDPQRPALSLAHTRRALPRRATASSQYQGTGRDGKHWACISSRRKGGFF